MWVVISPELTSPMFMDRGQQHTTQFNNSISALRTRRKLHGHRPAVQTVVRRYTWYRVSTPFPCRALVSPARVEMRAPLSSHMRHISLSGYIDCLPPPFYLFILFYSIGPCLVPARRRSINCQFSQSIIDILAFGYDNSNIG